MAYINPVLQALHNHYAAGAEEEEFDPAKHSVNDIADYIETHPEDYDRVMGAEKAGKNRKGVLKLERVETAEVAVGETSE